MFLLCCVLVVAICNCTIQIETYMTMLEGLPKKAPLIYNNINDMEKYTNVSPFNL